MSEGPETACRLIREEIENPTGVLDLRMLGLTEFPEEFFAPEITENLEELWLGMGFSDAEGRYPAPVQGQWVEI